MRKLGHCVLHTLIGRYVKRETMYNFSENSPEFDEPAVWALQNFLLAEAQERFGIRDEDKIIYQPTFGAEQPHIINTPDLDGAFACLSDNSKTYWPTTFYELAHETVHLLNPVVGYTNYLEEGFAVLFSVDMSEEFTEHAQEPEQDDYHYIEAWNLICELSDDLYTAAQNIREEFGSLGEVEVDGMIELFPDVDEGTLIKLCSVCDFT